MIKRLIVVFYFGFVAVAGFVGFCMNSLIWLVTLAFDRRLVAVHMFSCLWGSFVIRAMPLWSVRVAGREKIRKDTAYIMISNHQSTLDGFLAYNLFCPFKLVSKASVFKIPFYGWNLWLNRYVMVKRGDPKSMTKMLFTCRAYLERGSSVFFFAEGTRSPDGVLRPFHLGAFSLAKRTNAPLLLLAINGTGKAMPKKGLNYHSRQDLCIEVLGEIGVDEYAELTSVQLKNLVRSRIGAAVEEHRVFEAKNGSQPREAS